MGSCTSSALGARGAINSAPPVVHQLARKAADGCVPMTPAFPYAVVGMPAGSNRLRGLGGQNLPAVFQDEVGRGGRRGARA